MPYNDIEEAIELSRMGKGSLVSSIITNDMKIANDFVLIKLQACNVVNLTESNYNIIYKCSFK